MFVLHRTYDVMKINASLLASLNSSLWFCDCLELRQLYWLSTNPVVSLTKLMHMEMCDELVSILYKLDLFLFVAKVHIIITIHTSIYYLKCWMIIWNSYWKVKTPFFFVLQKTQNFEDLNWRWSPESKALGTSTWKM